ncbi:low affinity immunoglobulin epsilon Fc receptor-like isoform X1 [Acipenser ruthenus]|uniref:low affinity immunoglobulin epsilon Fc receptor-like isoform X1 n=1 Tax=Acipenser ruthenus TaxID=7906 RepID=UPI0027425796|nr:low affinity immunoglobulin epsilon Fc receptor-like isoform X1 [Acipenser ruthenus]
MAGKNVSGNFYTSATTDQREPEGKEYDSDYDDVENIVGKKQEKSNAFTTNIEPLEDSDYEEVDDIVEIHEQLNTEDKNDSKIHGPPVKSACGTRAIVLLYILLIISFVMWGVLLYVAIVKYSEISTEVQNLTMELSMIRENGSEMSENIQQQSTITNGISSQVRSMKTDISQLKTEGSKMSENIQRQSTITGGISSQVRRMKTDISQMKTEGSKMSENIQRQSAITGGISSQVRSMETDISQMKTEVAVSKSYIWEQFMKKYTFSTEKKKWGEARDICVSQGASLAVASSIAELAYLKERIEESHWIGLSDLETEGQWKWLDGTEVGKSYWKSAQPDNFNEEDCGEILQTGELNDSHCNTMKLWICEKWCNNTCLLFY